MPQSAVSFNPYGEIVYILKKTDKKQKDNPVYIATQSFVKTGERRDDEVAVLSGLTDGDIVVVSGQLKLKNQSEVVIDNSKKEKEQSLDSLNNDH